MLKIAYVLTPIQFGGAEKVNLNFLKNVDRNQYDVYPILLIRPWEDYNFFSKQVEETDYRIYKIPIAKKPLSEGRDYFRILRCIRNLYSILSMDSFHLIHSHGYFADIIGTPVSRILKIPHLSTCHGFISNEKNLRVYTWLDKFSLRFCKKIIAVSEEIKSDLVRSGIAESSIVVIQNAVQNSYHVGFYENERLRRRQLLQIGKDEFVIGYVGRLSEEKGVRYLIEAGLILKGKGIPFRIIVVGDGPERKVLEDLAKGKDLGERIIFVGFQGDAENWMTAMDVFVLPSLTEGTPMALLEAMACGIPVVASSVGGVPRVVVSGNNGILVAPRKSEEIADAVKGLYETEGLRETLAEEAKRTIRSEFYIDGWVRKIEAEYLQTIHEEGR
jgi:glycosyltransferase involved in cell wall biosynthesis